jgi:hypothetical protein
MLNTSFKSRLMLERWDSFSQEECEELARTLAKALPVAFRFHKIETCSYNEQQHHIAVFEWAGLPEGYQRGFFALIPGGKATLGYDREHPFLPDEQQLASWVEETQETGMFVGTLDELLDLTMTPLRQVAIEPFLLEMLASPLEPPPVYNKKLGTNGGWNWSANGASYAETLERLSREELRLPTSDEWEYACAAGSRTLFRWGNTTPSLPLSPPGSREAAQWDLHLRENPFGLLIARYPYHWEFCAESGIMRGGDGGTAIHGGTGTFAEWLTLASAFHSEWEDDDICYGAYLRRAFSLF